MANIKLTSRKQNSQRPKESGTSSESDTFQSTYYPTPPKSPQTSPYTTSSPPPVSHTTVPNPYSFATPLASYFTNSFVTSPVIAA
ncbi:uncharacterized protein ASPGLDRAFT_45605 [Aspergillus glaucus CBS 516.65]|uniref:Uncharacterized protein n=1 Tax=Aspergillus glaucus CBS 516.65 TaxID=1160497 RepID=A0A1L9VNX2_ASPGL|nr:hypothetical protein ASPGLDRAFT_45605 [Aspergillus glaucus CBS 516.65]OJJ85606.1 hypothetical protein ASPGLDRAFT_45605 [Aspergillus glaucus CBS 516.65]